MKGHLKNLLILIFFLPAALHAGMELPAFSDSDQIVRHTAYTLSYSEEHEQAFWAAYVLTREMLSFKCPRTDDFRPDPLVRTGSATPEDYRRSGFDRGHLVPAADMKMSRQCMSETFYMSNMSPQVPSFNRGIWKKLEELVRGWADENEEICVVTGPVLTDKLFEAIGENGVAVPARFYKAVLDYREPGLKAIAFIMPNARCLSSPEVFAVTVDAVEEITGIDFFPELPDDIEEALESSVDLDMWFPPRQ